MPTDETKTVVVIGNGMVGHRFVEKLIEYDQFGDYRIVTFCEEPRAAYDRVGLTSFFAHRDAHRLMLARVDWYREHGIELHIGDRADAIDRKRRRVLSDRGVSIDYDYVVLATGSYPFVPPIEGVRKPGVFVYRTIEDLEKIAAYSKGIRTCAVIGGGLLGLEAAKAAFDLGLETHVVEFAPRLMPRQIDDVGSRVLVRKIEDLGVRVHLNKASKEIVGHSGVEQVVFADGMTLDVEMIIISTGIRPRDELARDCGLAIGERGGVVVDEQLRTSDDNIFAVGEVAAYAGRSYGLVAPGYDMADIVAANLCGESRRFEHVDLSTKLKLMGIDVASFGKIDVPEEASQPLVFHDPFAGIYKKLIFDRSGTQLLGGVLVGEATDYPRLAALAASGETLPCSPGELMGVGNAPGSQADADMLSEEAKICSCNNITKGEIRSAIESQDLTTLDDVKTCTRAGAGCGGCLPLVADLLKRQLAAAGKSISNDLCEHFSYTRRELFDIVKVQEIRTFDELLASHGRGDGCEICKPVVASILASLWNDPILEARHATLQDTNDRFLANIQRGGLYSVIPRIPGGELTPEKLVVLGNVATQFGLYTKITGGQRIALFGAKRHELPDIWEALVEAGFESGHAYGKAVRTVKSCVGSTWCRYGVQDSVGFAIRVETRYRGLRGPHKIKLAVSGCVRECAEAQSKDVGLIATENGYNLYVGGNGGARPRHADLLATDLDEETAIRYIDRFLMYYIETADKLTRTAAWIDSIDGGIEQLRRIVIEDKLGIAEELERKMQFLVETYRCEWKDVVENEERRRAFRQFANTDERQTDIELVPERGQQRPADWPADDLPVVPLTLPAGEETTWIDVGTIDDFPCDGGLAVKYGEAQIAVFRARTGNEWYACQNMCPHKRAFVLSRGIIGSQGDEPKVACPLHKKTFSLRTGKSLSGEPYQVNVFPVKVEGERVLVELPPPERLGEVLATEAHCVGKGCTSRFAASGT